MPLTDLLRTKIHLVGIDGEVRRHAFGYELRTPAVPTFFHGTCLVLEDPPGRFDDALALHRDVFGDDVRHRLVVWGGSSASGEVVADAAAAGFTREVGVGLAVDEAPAADPRFAVRPLGPEDWPRIEALMRASDGADTDDGDPSYRLFKQQLRAMVRGRIERGDVTWWGAFEDDVLIGQCGMAHCDSDVGDGLGRFRSVEVHPDSRGRGVASSLVTTVARDAFERLGCRRVLLEADGEGPAIGLYRRIGFRPSGDEHGLLWSGGELVIRDEHEADRAGVRALVTAAFGQPQEAVLVDRLRDEPGVISRIAERDGQLHGHVLFSPVTTPGDPRRAMALAPLAVRPPSQRAGIGARLVRDGLDACRAAGAARVFVLGDPAYYGRFGFEPASRSGWTCRWTDGDAFQVLDLDPPGDDEPRGEVRYHPAFDAV